MNQTIWRWIRKRAAHRTQVAEDVVSLKKTSRTGNLLVGRLGFVFLCRSSRDCQSSPMKQRIWMRRRHQRPLLSKSARGGRAAVRLLTLTQSPQQPTENALHWPPPADDVAATRRNHGLWRPVNYSAEPTLSSAVMHSPPLIGRPHLTSLSLSIHYAIGRFHPISSGEFNGQNNRPSGRSKEI